MVRLRLKESWLNPNTPSLVTPFIAPGIYKSVWEQKLLMRFGGGEVVECTAAKIKIFPLFEVKRVVDGVVCTHLLPAYFSKRIMDITKGQSVMYILDNIVDRVICDFAIFDREFEDAFPVIQVVECLSLVVESCTSQAGSSGPQAANIIGNLVASPSSLTFRNDENLVWCPDGDDTASRGG